MRTCNSIRMAVVAAVFGFVGTAAGAIPGTLATFDVDAEGFVGSTIATTQIHLAADGNPDGFVQIRKDLLTGFDIGTRNSVTPGFLGDYATAGIHGAGFDLNVFNTSLDEAHLRFRRAVDENGWYYDFGPVTPDGNAWGQYDVVFDPTWDDATAQANGWTQESASPSFADLFANIGWIEVRVINEGSNIVGVDNVRIVPEPATLALLLVATTVLRHRR